MTFQLRPYQQATTDHVRNKRSPYRLCVEAPTGAGKSVIMSELMLDDRKQMLLTHRRILLDQLSGVLAKAGVKHTFRASGRKFDPSARVVLGMVQTEMRRMAQGGIVPGIERLHVDEIHTCRGPKYRAVFDAYTLAGADMVSYTATPNDLGGVIDEVYRVATVPQLIDEGYLTQPLVFSCGHPDPKLLDKLKTDQYGEYLASELDEIDKPKVIFGNVLGNMKRLNPDGRPFVLFAHSVKASIWWAQSFTVRGVPTAHIDGDSVWVDGEFYDSSPEKRAECFERIESGDLAGLSNRFVLREGFDCPRIGHAIITCPMGKRSTWVQACGRSLRPWPNRKYAVIQDHGGNIYHPALDSAEPWDWESPPGLAERQRKGGMRADEIPEPIVCPECKCTRYAGATCPNCGFRYAKRCRFVYQVDGSLRLMEGKTFRPRQTRPASSADLRAWKRHFWSARKNSNRTLEQAYTFFAVQNGWHWLPRNLPLMPYNEADWFLPAKDVPMNRLRPA